MANEIFISYSRKDFDKVKAIKDEIDHEVEIDCWMDLDGIESGNREFEEVIVSAINNHNTILFMLSPNSMNSKFALRELNYAERKEKRIILVYVEPCQMTDRFVFRYDEANTIDWQNPLQHNKLIADLRKWFLNNARHEKTIQELAEEGDAEAQYKIGCHYFKEDNFPEASKWLFKAANQGIIPAQAFSGWLYEHGEGSYIAYEENVRWYKKAGKQGDFKSQKEMEYFYEPGKGGVKTDRIQAVHWYRKAAEQRDVDAQYMLGECYYHGHGVKKDYTQAIYWYRKAAEQGDAEAQYDLGFCYDHGNGVKQDYTQAIYWYRKAAEQRHANSQYILGYFFEKGKGVKQDYTQAVYWYRKAAEQGHVWAQIYLGTCYEYGNGVKQDYTQAVYWYKKAVEEGEEDAMFYLGKCYELSVKDYSQAVYWYKKAAGGFGLLPDEAKKWLKAHNIDY